MQCEGCLSKVKPVLDQAEGISSWHLDLNHRDKILSVKPSGISKEEIIALVASRGFQAEAISES